MQFHYNEYVTHDPHIKSAAGTGLNRPDDLPDSVDILIVGTGPAGMLLAAQLSQFPTLSTRIVERRSGRLDIGRADGVQQRSVETFQAFGFAHRVMAESYFETQTHFYKPSLVNPAHVTRTATTEDDPHGISEFPHLIINQARVLDFFAEFAANSPARIRPDFGYDFESLTLLDEAEEFPLRVSLRHTSGEHVGDEKIVRAKYVVGCDGARSKVRASIGARLEGNSAQHAWGVMDILAETDFPTWRTKSVIQSSTGGTIITIPREGGYMVRMYVDMGEVTEQNKDVIRSTTLEEIITKANDIMCPYKLEARHVPWHSVYEVGHRLANKFDNVGEDFNIATPRVFIAGDACHTHSAKAGQGMNVSMQDAFNLGWKLGYVGQNLSPAKLLSTYAAERSVIAKDLIDFDREWSALAAKPLHEFTDPHELENYYVRTAEFPAGFRTQYAHSMLTGDGKYQSLAAGYAIGKRFKSAMVTRVCDGVPLHLGHLAEADGRWRIYVFADSVKPGQDSDVTRFAAWMKTRGNSLADSAAGGRAGSEWFDVKVIYQQPHIEVDIPDVPDAFLPRVGKFQLVNYENVFGSMSDDDIFVKRGISRQGAVVVVRPDQYVGNVFPLSATEEILAFFSPIFK